MGRVGSDHHVVHPHARQSVHHGALALQRYLRAAAPDARATRDAEGAWPQSPHKDTKHRNPAPRGAGGEAALKALHTGDATSLLARVVLPFAAPADLGRLEQACRFFGARTRGVCEAVARARLAAAGRHKGASPRPATRALWEASRTARVVVLRRRGGAGLHVARSLAALAFRAPEPRGPVLRPVSEAERAALGVSVTAAGAFTVAPAPAPAPRARRVRTEDARRLRVALRGLDASLALGECVVSSAPAAPGLEGVQGDGCWVLRRVDGAACWSPEAFSDALRGAGPESRLELERAYDRADLEACVAAPARDVLRDAKRAFGVAGDAALFTTSSRERATAAACWTDRSAGSLEDFGIAHGAEVVVMLVEA